MSDEKVGAYLWYPRDFAADEHVLMMTLAQEGLYRRLLDHQWLHGSIPAALPDLARLCKGLTVPTMRKLWPGVLPCFQPLPGDPSRLVNPKMERVRAEAAAYRANRKRAGQLGGITTQAKLKHSLSTNQAQLKPASASASPERTTTTTTAALFDAMETEADRTAIADFLAKAPAGSADTWAKRLRGYLQGLDMTQGKAAPPTALATACRDYGGDYSPAHFRRFIARAMREADSGESVDEFTALERKLSRAG